MHEGKEDRVEAHQATQEREEPKTREARLATTDSCKHGTLCAQTVIAQSGQPPFLADSSVRTPCGGGRRGASVNEPRALQSGTGCRVRWQTSVANDLQRYGCRKRSSSERKQLRSDSRAPDETGKAVKRHAGHTRATNS